VGPYPPESNHLLDVAALEQPDDVALLVVRDSGDPVGCGALRLRAGVFGELKRIFVDPRARGVRLGHRIAQQLEQHAVEHCLPTCIWKPEFTNPKRWRCSGLRALSSASRLADPLSVFMQKKLGQK
jgi:putative acetyltransferase